MNKLTVTFEQDGRRYRTLSVEGSDADIAAGLVALGIEWQAKTQSGLSERDILQAEIAAALLPKYGPGVVDRLNDRMEKASSGAAEAFWKRVIEGRAKWDELPQYIASMIRTEFLSECPDFPEALLDRAINIATADLRTATGL